MSTIIIRMVAALAIAIVFVAQARRAPARSSRQVAFGLGAAAFAVFALSNGLALATGAAQAAQVAGMAGIVLMGLSLLMLVRAYTRGEMSDKLRRAQEMVAEERARTKERR